MSGKKVETPCVSVCMMNADEELCYGCYRTLEEIAGWQNYTPKERDNVLQKLQRRKILVDQSIAK